jgi:hypothetical protein
MNHASDERAILDTKTTVDHLFANSSRLNTTTAVNRVLEKLFELIANNRIPMRNAGLLAYVGSLLLNSVTDVKSEMYHIKGSAGVNREIAHAIKMIETREDEDSDEEDSDESDSESGANLSAKPAAKSA